MLEKFTNLEQNLIARLMAIKTLCQGRIDSYPVSVNSMEKTLAKDIIEIIEEGESEQ